MGWVAEEYDDKSDKPPVDELIDKLAEYLNSKSEICFGYAGLARNCCDKIQSCFVTLRNTLENIKAIQQDSQDLESACSQVLPQLDDVTRCVDNEAGRCHVSVSRSSIRTPFYESINELYDMYHEVCTPTTSTTTTTTTTKTTTTSTATTTETTTVETTTETPTVETTTTISTSTTTIDATEQTTYPGGNIITPGEDFIRSNVTSLPENNDDTIIIASSVVGATLCILAIVVVTVFCIWRKRNPGTYGSDTSANSRKGFIWRWLHTSKPENQYADSEIYTEIDEAFMDAVYNASRDPAPKARDKNQTTAQINICYGTGEDDIIPSKRQSVTKQDVSEYEIPLPSSPREPQRGNDVIITSSIRHGAPSIITQQSGYQNITKGVNSNAVLVLSNKNSFLMSRPAFTAINQSTSAEYVQIEARLPNENIYTEPNEIDNVYDKTTRFGVEHNPDKTSQNIYNTTRAFNRNTDIDKTGVTKRKQNRNNQQEMRNKQPSPNYIYENPCLEY